VTCLGDRFLQERYKIEIQNKKVKLKRKKQLACNLKNVLKLIHFTKSFKKIQSIDFLTSLYLADISRQQQEC